MLSARGHGGARLGALTSFYLSALHSCHKELIFLTSMWAMSISPTPQETWHLILRLSWQVGSQAGTSSFSLSVETQVSSTLPQP